MTPAEPPLDANTNEQSGASGETPTRDQFDSDDGTGTCDCGSSPSTVQSERGTHESKAPDGGTGKLSATSPPTSPDSSERAVPVGAALPAVPGYKVLSILGRGGMGIVYKAQHVSLDRVVALKMILVGAHAGPDLQARFRREARAVARLKHPNFVQIYEVGEHEGMPFLCLEYVEGITLQKRLVTGSIPVTEAAALVETIARAMQHAHRQAIIHRDLKPANIIMSAGGVPKVTDFGLARQLDDTESFTSTGAAIGTPAYMAPEQAQGSKKEIGPATDVYALGAIFYQMLTGTPPFKADTPLETMMKVISESPIPPRLRQANVPPAAEAICMKCLKKDPLDRYESAEALADDLACFLAGEPTEAMKVHPPPSGWIPETVVDQKSRFLPAILRRRRALSALLVLGGMTWVLIALVTRRHVDSSPFSPHVTMLSPVQGLTLYEGRDKREVRLEAKISPAAAVREAAVLINGVRVTSLPTTGSDVNALSATVGVAPGLNRLQLRLLDPQGQTVTSDAVDIRYLRPPGRIQFDPVEPAERPFVTLTARLNSATALESAVVRVNGRAIVMGPADRDAGSDETPQILWAQARDRSWYVRLHDIPLAIGSNTITLEVRNADAACLQPGSLTVRYDGVGSRKPYVEILAESNPLITSQPVYRLRYRVFSKTALDRVRVLCDGRVTLSRDVPNNQRAGGGDFELNDGVAIALAPGPNRVAVEASSGKEVQQALATIYYAADPLRIDIERLEVDGSKQTLTPRPAEAGRLVFNEPAQRGRVWICGRVSGPESVTSKLDPLRWMRVWVNGFEVLCGAIDTMPTAKGWREFRVPIQLYRSVGNYIEIDFPGLKQQIGEHLQFRLDCSEPESGAVLHLLAVGVGVDQKEIDKLREQALRSIQATRTTAQEWRSPDFREIRLYGPLVGYVRPERVYTQLYIIKQTIDLLREQGQAQHVVLIYWDGKEQETPQGRFLLSSLSKIVPVLSRSAVSWSGLLSYAGETKGHVLFRHVPR